MQTYFKQGMGAAITLYMELFKNNVGQTGESPVAAIQKKSTSQWLNNTKDGWLSSYNTLAMAEADSVNLPGIYSLDITHIDSSSETYNVYYTNGGTVIPGSDFESYLFTGAVYVPSSSAYSSGTVLGNLDIIQNKDGARTFDQSTDSLEAISDTGLSVTNLGDIANAVWTEPSSGYGGDTTTMGFQLLAGGTPTGNNVVTIKLEDIDTSNEITDAFVRINGEFGSTVVSRGYSDASGNFVTALDNGNYKVVLRKSFYEFNVPETLTVSGSGTFTYAGSGFSPSTASSSGDTCVVYGWVTDVGGSPVRNAVIAATETSVTRLTNSRKIVKLSKSTKSTSAGYFELELLRSSVLMNPDGVKYKITMTYPGFSYETNITVPDSNTAEFSTLV